MSGSRLQVEQVIPISLVVFALLLATVACVAEENMGLSSTGTPPSDCNPVIFTLLGETDHIWEMELVPESGYQVIVESLDSLHPIDQVRIIARLPNLENIADNTVSPSGTHMATTRFMPH